MRQHGANGSIILNNVMSRRAMIIPKGTSKADIETRRRIIEAHLGKIKGKSFRCPCLGGVHVRVEAKSIDEIAEKAGLSYSSTKAALQLRNLIREARFVRMTLPKDNASQKKKFQLIFMYELQATTTDGRIAKLTIGVREFPLKFLQYCVTSSE